jgi:hypothetical protein
LRAVGFELAAQHEAAQRFSAHAQSSHGGFTRQASRLAQSNMSAIKAIWSWQMSST